VSILKKLRMKKEDIRVYEKLLPQLSVMQKEFTELSKKKPDDHLNLFKLGLINQLLEEANKLIGDMKPFASFDTFKEEEMPSNSDAVLILSQYVSALSRFKKENTVTKTVTPSFEFENTEEFWKTED